MSSNILLIEDDASGRELAVYNLENAGYRVLPAPDGRSGLDLLETEPVDLVITDVKMPGMSGLDVLAHLTRTHPSLPVIVITAYADVEMAVDAMKQGAREFLGKPFSRDHLLLVVERVLQESQLRAELKNLRVASTGVERPIVHRSTEMAQLLMMADRFAASDATVLIQGPSGTGKELVARRIHAKSDRAMGPFVPVNLAAMPESLVESELFGHVKGAFTGAGADRPGKFRQADGGTLFLDEIGELPPSVQSKLLRVLQEKIVDVVGSDTPQPVDVRVVAATNRDLTREVHEGRFREDLFYRINVVQLLVPPLKERQDDIEPLLRHFVEQFAEGRTVHIPDPLLQALQSHPWNGNVREMENVCQRLVLLAPANELRVGDLPFGTDTGDPTGTIIPANLPPDGLSLVDLEKQVISRVLDYKEWNVSQAAEYLKVPRHVLAYRMEKYGLSKPTI